METRLLPTHTCFDDSLDLIEELVRAGNVAVEEITLAHGICVMPTPDVHHYAHAWVEVGPQGERSECVCMFKLIVSGKPAVFATPLEEFYRDMRVIESTTYTVAEALAENKRTEMYGPWKEEYLALCRPRDLDGAIDRWVREMGSPRVAYEARRHQYLALLESGVTLDDLDRAIRRLGPAAPVFIARETVDIERFIEREVERRRYKMVNGKLVRTS